MKVSELAKELGYKTPELVVVAKRRGIDLADKSELAAQIVAVIKAKVPPASRLTGPDLDTLKVFQDEARKEKERRDEEKRKKEEEKARKEAEKLAKKEAKEARQREKELKEQAKAAKAAPAPSAPATPAPVTPAAVPAHAPDPRKVTRRREVDITAALQEAKKREAEKFQAQIHGKMGREIVTEKPKRRASEPVVKLKDDEEDVRVMRPTEVDRFAHESEKEKAARAAAAAAKAKAKGAKIEPPKEKEKVRPKRHDAPAPAPAAAESQGYQRPTMRRLMPSLPAQPRPKTISPSERKIQVTPPITIRDFSEVIGVKVADIMRKLMDQGMMPRLTDSLDKAQIEDMALMFDRNVEIVDKQTLEETVTAEVEEVDDPKDLVARSPIVTFMGHVDHGKTSLMDKIRQANVAEKEFGGITQHIGAYRVKLPDGRMITFLDTPGHEAFTAMRSRGAHVTDIAVIVVAADEGVMPQTEEAINHAKAAEVTIMVAINKVDKPQANVQRTKQQLAKLELNPEEWGGQTIMVEVSALTGKNVPQLLEMILLQSEVLDLKANPRRKASGIVLEARKDPVRGVLSTCLVQNGTLRKGEILLCGAITGRVRAMFDEFGRPVEEAGPANPVEVLGLEDVPEAGERFQVVDTMGKAQEIAETRKTRSKTPASGRGHLTLETLFEKMGKGVREVKVILKADVKGSLEALQYQLAKLSHKEVQFKLIHVGVGAISESDVLLADASDGIILGFNIPVDDRAKELAKTKGVDIKVYNIIYELVDQVKAAMEGLLEPDRVEESIGRLEVKQLFKVSRLGTIAGCMVREGRIERTALVRVIRGNQILHTGKLESLKRFKDDVKEVAQGYECGVKVKDFDNVQPGDQIEAYVIKEIARRLTEAPKAK